MKVLGEDQYMADFCMLDLTCLIYILYKYYYLSNYTKGCFLNFMFCLVR